MTKQNISEAVARRCSLKTVFLKMSQNSKESPTQVFSCKFCEIFKNNFYRTLQVAASNILLKFVFFLERMLFLENIDM